MSNDKKFQDSSKPEMSDEEAEKWNPTSEVFEAFLVRDQELATSNVRLLLEGRTYPIGLKELKGSTLHSSETIDRVLANGIKNGTIQEVKGEYLLSK